MANIKVKNNIKGKINNTNRLYKDSDAESLEALFPENSNQIVGLKQNRKRLVSELEVPEVLPTAGLLPYPIDETDHIGEYESKKNIYLTLAHAFNKAMKRIEVLEQEIKDLKIK